MKKGKRAAPTSGLFDPDPVAPAPLPPAPVLTPRPEPQHSIVIGEKYTWKTPAPIFTARRIDSKNFVWLESPSGREVYAPAEELRPVQKGPHDPV